MSQALGSVILLLLVLVCGCRRSDPVVRERAGCVWSAGDVRRAFEVAGGTPIAEERIPEGAACPSGFEWPTADGGPSARIEIMRFYPPGDPTAFFYGRRAADRGTSARLEGKRTGASAYWHAGWSLSSRWQGLVVLDGPTQLMVQVTLRGALANGDEHRARAEALVRSLLPLAGDRMN